jgi:glucosylceramidase
MVKMAAGTPVIEIDPATSYQQIAGFGAAITDASAWLIQQRMTPPQRDALMRELFGRGGKGKGRASAVLHPPDHRRLGLLAHPLQLRRHAARPERPAAAHFSLDAQRDTVLPAVKAALASIRS